MKRTLAIVLALSLALPLTAAQFTLTWSDNSTNELGFVVERAPGLNATLGFVEIASVPANATSYVDAGLADGVSFSYRVRAWNLRTASGPVQYSPYSNVASGTTPAPEAAPAAPGTLQMTWPAKLVNISTRLPVGSSGEPVVAGFVLDGPATVLVRGVGPGLAQWLPGTLADPRITLLRGGETLGSNEDWSSGTAEQTSAIVAASARVGAFALASGSKDAALVATLPAGQYTVHLTAPSGDVGTALIEVYLVPPSVPLP